MRLPVDHPRHKSIVRSLSNLVMSFETTPVVVGVEGPGGTVGGLETRLFASLLIDALSLSDWFPVVPVEDGAGQSTTSLASMGPGLGAF